MKSRAAVLFFLLASAASDAQETGKWKQKVVTDPMTDKSSAVLILPSDSGNGVNDVIPTLGVSCSWSKGALFVKAHRQFEVTLETGRDGISSRRAEPPAGARTDRQIDEPRETGLVDVDLRFDDGPVQKAVLRRLNPHAVWTPPGELGISGSTTGYQEFVLSLRTHSKLLIAIFYDNGDRPVFEFDLRGFGDALKPLEAACKPGS